MNQIVHKNRLCQQSEIKLAVLFLENLMSFKVVTNFNNKK